jgi:hypothetical protein
MIRQMPFMLPLILSVVAAVFNNDEAQSSGHFIGRRKVECFQAGRGFRGLRAGSVVGQSRVNPPPNQASLNSLR